jgi:heme oxygenase
MLNPPLSVQLRDGTQDSHRRAESTSFIQTFFAGKLSTTQYRNFLLQLFFIFIPHWKRIRIHVKTTPNYEKYIFRNYSELRAS